jgi:ATP-binding cassette subfamily B protein
MKTRRSSRKGGFRRAIRFTGLAVKLMWQADRKTVLLTGLLQLVSGLGIALLLLVGRKALSVVLNAPTPVEGLEEAIPWFGVVLVIYVFLNFAYSAHAGIHKLLAERTVRYFQDRILKAAAAVDLKKFESPEFYDRLRRAQENGSMTPLQVSLNLPILTGGLLTAVGIMVALAFMKPVLVPFVVIAAIPLWVVTSRNTEEMYSFSFGQTPGDRVRQHLNGLLTLKENAPEVRAFQLSEFLRDRWNRIYDQRIAEARAMVIRFLKRSVIGSMASTLVMGLSIAAMLFLVLTGEMKLEVALPALVALQQLHSTLQAMGRSAGTLYESTMHLDDYEAFVQIEVPEERATQEIPPFSHLQVQDLTFTYPGSPKPALDGVSMDIRAGEVVALVGENGSGKTTLAKLLAHLYYPDLGRILWDGLDTSGADPEAIRRQVALIFQDFVRYRLLARENIGVGDTLRIDEKSSIITAAKAAGAHGFIEGLSSGYDTQLGKEFAEGTDLSVGQWQRMALARAFFRNAPFIILDEPTASLDARAEHELFESIRNLTKGRAVLLISHRFSTVRSADRIYVLDSGKIIEHGSHRELMELGGTYSEMFNLQASSYVDVAQDSLSP